MAGEESSLAVVIAPESAEEASRCATALRAGGFNPTIGQGTDEAGRPVFQVLAPEGELAEAMGFLRGLKLGQSQAAQPPVPTYATRPAAPARTMAGPPRAALAPSYQARPPGAGRVLVLLTGLIVVAGSVAALVSMLQFLTSLRDH